MLIKSHIKTHFHYSSCTTWSSETPPAGFIVGIQNQIQKLDCTNDHLLPTNEITKTKFVEIKLELSIFVTITIMILLLQPLSRFDPLCITSPQLHIFVMFKRCKGLWRRKEMSDIYFFQNLVITYIIKLTGL